jgi:hypothetical protein
LGPKRPDPDFFFFLANYISQNKKTLRPNTCQHCTFTPVTKYTPEKTQKQDNNSQFIKQMIAGALKKPL